MIKYFEHTKKKKNRFYIYDIARENPSIFNDHINSEPWDLELNLHAIHYATGSCFRSLELPRSAKASCLRSVRQQSDYFKNFRVGGVVWFRPNRCQNGPLHPPSGLYFFSDGRLISTKRKSWQPFLFPASYSFYVLLDAICSSLLVIGWSRGCHLLFQLGCQAYGWNAWIARCHSRPLRHNIRQINKYFYCMTILQTAGWSLFMTKLDNLSRFSWAKYFWSSAATNSKFTSFFSSKEFFVF